MVDTHGRYPWQILVGDSHWERDLWQRLIMRDTRGRDEEIDADNHWQILIGRHVKYLGDKHRRTYNVPFSKTHAEISSICHPSGDPVHASTALDTLYIVILLPDDASQSMCMR